MHRLILAFVLVGAVVGASSARAAEPVEPTRGEDLVIMLVTFSPGDDITSWFGHSALVVEDRRTKDSRLYNYGEFGFDATVAFRYALGRLEFWVGERPVEHTFDIYRRQERAIQVQELALTPAERLELALFLRNNALPANRGYLYDHFTDNCATRPRDAIDLVTHGRLRANADPGRMTLREHTRRHTARSPVMSTLIDFVMNSDVDRPLTRWEESFLPSELALLVAPALVTRSWIDHEAPARAPIPERPPHREAWMLLIGGVVAVAAVLSRRSPRALGALSAAAGVVVGGPGLVLLVMWTATDHLVAHGNENVLLANPLTLLSLPLGMALVFGVRRAQPALRWLWAFLAIASLVALGLKALPWFDQDNWNILALIVPMAVGLASAHRRAALDLIQPRV
ncbi:MAG: DUF4105 domain-containing protein [Deltaproteobacteria bacterium]|nr:DUF4105 domain-containing protein [Deltaproteobacteria bacterium]